MDLQVKLNEIQENFRESHISAEYQNTQKILKEKKNSRPVTPDKKVQNSPKETP